MNLRSLPTFLSLAAFFLSNAPAIAAPVAVPERTIPIVYTSMLDGIYNQFGNMNEMGPVFDPANRDEIRTDGFRISVDTLHRAQWYLFSPDHTLSPQQAKEVFASGLKVKGTGIAIPALVSDYATVFQLSDANPPWLVPYLFDKLQADGRMPDVTTTTAKLFDVAGGSGTRLQLYSQDGSLPTAEECRQAQGWQWTISGHVIIKRGRQETLTKTFGRTYGSTYALALARQMQTKHQALRVDAGNLMVSLGDPLADLALADTLQALPEMGLDALVPFKRELSLTPALQEQLARTVPLVVANLKGPASVPIRPFVIHERQGMRIAIIGLADTDELKRAGLLGGKTGWSGDDPAKALSSCLNELKHERIDATILVTNLKEERLADLRDRAVGIAAIISPHESRGGSFSERLVPTESNRIRDPRPWLTAGASSPQVGMVTLGFQPRTPNKNGTNGAAVAWIENEVRLASDTIPDPYPERSYAFRSMVNDFIASRSASILPDMRVVAKKDKRLSDKKGEPFHQFRAPQWSAMTASCLRRACDAELALIPPLPGSDHTMGEVPRYFVDGWVPSGEKVAITSLSGAKLKRLLAMDPDHDRFVLAGCNPEKNLIGGRPINDAEVYRLATTAGLTSNEAYAFIFNGESTTALRLKSQSVQPAEATQSVHLQEVTLAQLDAMKSRNDGFSGSYFDDLLGLLFDDGTETTPRWTLSLKPFQGSFQQFRVSNRAPFGEVRNSQINTPDNTAWGGKGNLALTYETADLDWENKVLAEYQQAQFETSGRSFTQKLNDNLQLSSEFRLKFIKLQTQNTALEMVPFVSANYQSEFTPTTDQKSGQANPRRQELSGIAGAVLYPGTWLKEIRLGAIAKDDLAVGSGRFQPGVQLAGSIEQPLGPLNFSFDADLKNYFLTPDDTPSDLGLVGQVGAGLNFPLWGGLSLRVGVDSLLFTGKVASNRSLGSSVTPSIGLSYNTTWKPMQGLVY